LSDIKESGMQNGNNWNECKREIYCRLDQSDKKTDKVITSIEVLTAKLTRYVTENEVFKKEIKIKAGLWGAISGAIPILLTIAIGLFIYMIQK